MWERSGDSLANNQHVDIGWLISQMLCPGNRGFAYCRIKLGVHSDQGTWQDADLFDSDSQTRNFASPRDQFAHIQERKWLEDSPFLDNVFWNHLTRKAGETPENYTSQDNPVRMQVNETDHSQSKTSTRHGGFLSIHRQRDSFIAKVQYSSKLLSIKSLFGKLKVVWSGFSPTR